VLTEKVRARLSGLTGSIGLRARFILIGIAVLVPLVAVMLQLAQYERDAALASAVQRIGLLASLTADRQLRFMQRAQIVVSQIASDRRVLEGGDRCNAFLAEARAHHNWMTGIRSSALDGSGICGDPPEAVQLTISDSSHFKRVLAGEVFAVSGMLTSQQPDGRPIIGVGLPLREGDRLVGVLSAAIELEALTTLLPTELVFNANLVIDVIDRNGVVLARHPHVAELVGRPAADEPVLLRALQQPNGIAELPDLKGAARLFAFHKIDAIDWVVAVGVSRASVIEPIESSLHKRLALIAAIVATSCLVGLLGGEAFVFRPLRALTNTAQALERGDYGARPRLTGVSEVGALERALYAMAKAVEQRENDLKATQAAREQAVRDAKRANEAKSQFLATVSHEVRTPLGGIVGYTELLLGQDLESETRRYAERIEVAAAAVISLIDGILEVSRIEAGEIEIEPRPFSLPTLLDDAVSIIRASAERKGLVLAVDLSTELPAAVLGDETRLRQVLLNLLTNAIKFTASGSVTLQVRRAEGDQWVRFTIRDTGIGVAEQHHHRLFKRFSQAHDAGRRHYGGTGLGLAICKELVGLMGGRLGFASELGRGSTFWIELALPQVDVAELEQQSLTVQSARAGKILVADNFEMSQDITRAMLAKAGHRVDVVGDGAQAVEALRHQVYDLVLMDIEMGGMNGIAATKCIRQLDAPARHVPVIAMTANVLPQQARAFKAAGMDGHLGKPFTRNQLIAKVNEFLSPARPRAVSRIAPASGAPVHDANALAEMKALLGELRTAAWLEALREQVETILSPNNGPISRVQLASSAHSLVSQAGSLGFTRLSRLSSELEDACAQHADYADALGHVKKACRVALSRIDRMQDSDPPAAHLERPPSLSS
jgi:signal transduction histidine kinase/CheY-like chemotaxis protein/HPt (histidine-containing phosphotransfer) domain-containing protein